VQEAVVLQVIVHVGDQQVEHQPAPELAHILRGRVAVGADGVGDLGVAAILLARGLQQRRGRLVGDAAVGSSRSKRRMTATGTRFAQQTTRAGAASMPACAASFRASTSPRVTLRVSPTLGNLPMASRPSSSTSVHLGRMPPSDVPLPCR
jgi:hypothetical protein